MADKYADLSYDQASRTGLCDARYPCAEQPDGPRRAPDIVRESRWSS